MILEDRKTKAFDLSIGVRDALLLFLFLIACSDDIQEGQLSLAGFTMGTSYNVKVPNLPASLARKQVEIEIQALLETVDQRLSTYLEFSELSRFNRNPSIDWVDVSSMLYDVVAESLDVSRLSGGAFDVTIGPLVNLWGFGPDQRSQEIPIGTEITEKLEQTGYRFIDMRQTPPAIKKSRPDIYIDLSAIAKGYGVDQVAEYLGSLGIDNYMVEIGGEIRVKGYKKQGGKWMIGIEKPTPEFRAVQQIIAVTDTAVATSGDYRNYYELKGERFSHTIDPRSGYPITHRLASVTILDGTAMHADAMATALLVLGSVEGFELAQRENLAALFIVKSDDGFFEKPTAEFSKRFKL